MLPTDLYLRLEVSIASSCRINMPFKFNSKNVFVLLVKVFPGLTNVKTTNISVCKKNIRISDRDWLKSWCYSLKGIVHNIS